AGIAGRDVGRQRDLAIFAEARAAPAGGQVEGDETRIIGAEEDPRGTGGISRGDRIAPDRDAAADEAVPRPEVGGERGIEYPDLAPGCRIERDHAVVRGAEDELAVGKHRRSLERAVLERSTPPRRFAGVIGPGEGELADIVAGDLPG